MKDQRGCAVVQPVLCSIRTISYGCLGLVIFSKDVMKAGRRELISLPVPVPVCSLLVESLALFLVLI